jgi:hypothetical protein
MDLIHLDQVETRDVLLYTRNGTKDPTKFRELMD